MLPPLHAFPGRPGWLTALAALGVALVLAGADAAEARVYKWVDEDGGVHYTIDRSQVPERLRPRLHEPRAVAVPSAAPAKVPGTEPPVTRATDPADTPRPEAPVPDAAPPAVREVVVRPLDVKPLAEPARVAPAADEAPGDEVARVPEATPHAPVGATPLPPIDTRGLGADPGELDAIRQLELQIAQDREVLKSLISQQQGRAVDLAEDPRMREIAERLPRLQAELAALRAESRP